MRVDPTVRVGSLIGSVELVIRRILARLLTLNRFRIGETESRHLVSTNEKRKQGDEHSLRSLAGALATRINVIIVTASGHRIDH